MNDENLHLRGFLERHRIAKDSNSKEMRLTMHDADSLSAAIGVLLAKSLELAEQVIDLQKQILSAEIKQDGGNF